MLFRRMNRWRLNSAEWSLPLSRFGYFRGYIKYGVFLAYVYLAGNYVCKSLTLLNEALNLDRRIRFGSMQSSHSDHHGEAQ